MPPSAAPKPVLVQLTAILRAVQWFHWTAHWATQGYESHLLFGKLYSEMSDEIDTLGEKTTGMGIHLDPLEVAREQVRMHTAHPAPTTTPGSLTEAALGMEKHLLEALNRTAVELERSGQLTLGMDDFLAGACNSHETAIYLLGQQVRAYGLK